MIGTTDWPPRLTICVNSSLFESLEPGALDARPSGIVSWSGLRREDSRKPAGGLDGVSVCGVLVDVRVFERLVVSTTVGEYWEDGSPRYVRTASRICSNAIERS